MILVTYKEVRSYFSVRDWPSQSTHHAVVDGLPLLLVRDELLPDPGEVGQLVEATHLVPGRAGQPGGGVGVGVLETDTSREQETPLLLIDLLTVLQQVHAQDEREQQLGESKIYI